MKEALYIYRKGLGAPSTPTGGHVETIPLSMNLLTRLLVWLRLKKRPYRIVGYSAPPGWSPFPPGRDGEMWTSTRQDVDGDWSPPVRISRSD